MAQQVVLPFHAGQLVIVFTIRRFGALVFATIMTTRQFASVLLSCITFGHPLTPGQWCALHQALHYVVHRNPITDL